jgi:hypothetical protein
MGDKTWVTMKGEPAAGRLIGGSGCFAKKPNAKMDTTATRPRAKKEEIANNRSIPMANNTMWRKWTTYPQLKCNPPKMVPRLDQNS